MRISRIYLNEPLEIGETAMLSAATSHYLTRVLRCSLGAQIELFNGDGKSFLGKLTKADKKHAEAAIQSLVRNEPEPELRLHLYQSLVSNEKMDWVIQKSTELGVSSITPIATKRSEIKLNSSRLAKKQAHWQKIIVSACEQSGRNRLPELNLVKPLNEVLASSNRENFLVLEPSQGRALSQLRSAKTFSLLIGPEGGFANEELVAAKAANAQLLKMGPRVLRTETAGLAALSGLQALYGDWG